MGITHIAAQPIVIATVLRQRCAWCGAVILQHSLDMLAMQVDVEVGRSDLEQVMPPTWPQSAMVGMDGNASWVIEGNVMPADACGKIDPEVTR